MAKGKGKGKGKGPAVENVEIISPEQLAAAGGSITKTMGTSAVNTNIKGGQISGNQGYIDLATGGALTINPLLQQQYNTQLKDFTKEGKKLLGTNTRLEKQIAAINKQLGNPKLKDNAKAKLESKLQSLTSTLESNESRLQVLNTEITNLPKKLSEGQPSIATQLQDTLAPTFSQVDKVRGMLGQQGKIGAAGQAFMDYVGKGYTPGQITSQNVTAAQMSAIPDIAADQVTAARMGNFGAANAVRAENVQNVGLGQLGDTLMGEALRRTQLQGRLDPQATRDAIQSARQGFASRGLVTGNAALGAELLNRDRYQRQRAFEDLGFAQQVQGQDLSRQFQNQQTQLGLSLANQQAAMQAELANLDARYKAAVQQGDWEMAAAAKNQAANLAAAQSNQQMAYNVGALNTQQQNVVSSANADRALQAAVGNEEAQRMGTQLGANLLGMGMNTEKAYQDRNLAAGMQLIDLETSYNPTMMAMGFDPYGGKTAGTQAMGPASNMASAWINAATEGAMFNANANNWASGMQWMMNNQPSAQGGGFMPVGTLGGAAAGMYIGGPTGAAVGGLAGLGFDIFNATR